MIHELSVQLVGAWHETSGIELIAALLAIAYLLLAIRQRLSCWIVSFASSCLYVWILFNAHLYMESGLNAFYAGMALYGFWQWQRGAAGAALAVRRWRVSRHVAALLVVTALSTVSYFLLRRFTSAALPFPDSMVTWASAFATFLVARKVYENWYWWLIIDSASLCLYFSRHLFATTALFGLYIVLIFFGMRAWRRSLSVPAHASA